MDGVQNLTRLGRALGIGALCGVMLSVPLWLGAGTLPALTLTGFPLPFDFWLGVTLIAVSLVSALRPPVGRLALALALLFLLSMLLYLMRAQPWAYQYALMLAAVGLGTPRKEETIAQPALDTCRLIIASVYLWSGLHKINIGFAREMVPWLAQPLLENYPNALEPILAFGVFAPLIETGLGIMLLFRPTQRLAVVGAIVMHAGILLAIGPLGRSWNAVVWPWNLVMMYLCGILFWARPRLDYRALARRPAFLTLVIVAALMPALNFVNMWPAYFSWALYSSDTYESEIRVEAELLPSLTETLRRAVYQNTDTPPGFVNIDPILVAVRMAGVPPPPEPVILGAVGEFVCSLLPDGASAELILKGRSDRFRRKRVRRTVSCIRSGDQVVVMPSPLGRTR